MMKIYNVGERITAVKHGKLIEGTVTDWRCRYGVSIQYTVQLNKPVQYRWRPNEDIYTILVKCSEVITEENV